MTRDELEFSISQYLDGTLAAAERDALDKRLAITLFAIEGRPQKEVAETLDCSVEAVKWHVFQGRKKLKDLLKGYL